MWCLPSRGRPEFVKEFFKCYRETHADSPGILWMDCDDPCKDDYLEIDLPKGWFFVVHERMTIGEIENAIFQKYPNEPWYGLLGDDIRPRTPYWDAELIKAAGSRAVAYGNDGIHGRTHASHPVIGGDLVREIGWLALPGTKRLYQDNAIMEIGKRKGELYYLPEVKMEHMHWSNGKRAMDSTDDKDCLLHDKAIYDEWIKSLRKPVPFVCVQAENYLGRGAEYVNILFDMVRRNLPAGYPGRFVCFTDNPDGLAEHIEARPLPGNLKGWWNKLYLFKRGHFAEGERIIYLDLDTVITGGLDDVVSYDGDFALLKDFYHPCYAPGMMLWRGGFGHDIWDSYERAEYPTDMELGDLEWINHWLKDNNYKPHVIQNLFRGQVGSFKVNAQHDIPKGMRVVCFHGLPRPHQVKNGWMEHVWKIGGMTTAEFEVVCNTEDDTLIHNIHQNLARGLQKLRMEEPHQGHAVIVGGGPSLKNHLDSLKMQQAAGAIVFSTNNAHKYLLENGIKAECHVMLDPRPENAAFVPLDALCFYCSHCAPEVFEAAKHNEVVLYHNFAHGIQEIIGYETGDPLVGGGCSVGLKALTIAFIMGYRNFHLYGFDSSYAETHHAYPQPLNDKEKVIEVTVNGQKYKVAPWMVTQVEEFKQIVPQLISAGAVITVYGEGLLPDVARLMALPDETAIATPDLPAYNSQNSNVELQRAAYA